jgi:hypothetical protein
MTISQARRVRPAFGLDAALYARDLLALLGEVEQLAAALGVPAFPCQEEGDVDVEALERSDLLARLRALRRLVEAR